MLNTWLAWPEFSSFALLLALASSAALLWLALRRLAGHGNVAQHRKKTAKLGSEQRSEQLFAQQQREWHLQFERGELPEETFAALLQEARRQLELDSEVVAAGNGSGAEQAAAGWQRGVLVVFAGLVPALAWLLYSPSGCSLGAVDQYAVAGQLKQLQQAREPAAQRDALQGLQAQLELHTRAPFPDPQLLQLHAELLLARGNYAEAIDQYQRLLQSRNDDAAVMAQLAEVYYLQANANQAVQTGTAFPAPASQWLDRALQLQPDQPRALGLAGIRAFAGGDFQQAIQAWQRALVRYAPGTREYNMVSGGIAAAQAKLGNAAPSDTEQKPPEAIVKLQVTIDRQQLRSTDTRDTPVFVFARAANGPRMPLAARRLQLGDLPASITLSEHDRMAAQSLADTDRVIVAARLARSNQPGGASGDLRSAELSVDVQRTEAQRMALEQATVHVLNIDQLQP